MVRRPAAVLAAPATAVAYVLLAGELPDAGRFVAACTGALAVAACAFAPLPARDDPVALAVLGVGAALLAAALNGRDVGAGATPVEALLAAAAGLLFATAFAVPAVVATLPLLVAGIDVAAALGGGGGPPVAAGDQPGVLTLDLPAWGGGEDVARLGLLDAVFLAMFAAWALRFALRPRVTIPLMAAGLAASAGLAVVVDGALPALPFLAAAFLLPVADRLPPLVRAG